MSTALIRDIRSALFDFERPLPEDVTLTTGVRELIAAVSESEDDLLRVTQQRDDLSQWRTAAILERNRLQMQNEDLQASLTNALATGRLAADRYRALRKADRLVAFAVGIAFAVVAHVLWTVL